MLKFSRFGMFSYTFWIVSKRLITCLSDLLFLSSRIMFLVWFLFHLSYSLYSKLAHFFFWVPRKVHFYIAFTWLLCAWIRHNIYMFHCKLVHSFKKNLDTCCDYSTWQMTSRIVFVVWFISHPSFTLNGKIILIWERSLTSYFGIVLVASVSGTIYDSFLLI